MKNGLKSRDFEAWWGSSRWVVSPAFCIFDAADRMAIGAKLYYHAKVSSFRDSMEFRLFVYEICRLRHLCEDMNNILFSMEEIR